MFKTPEDDAELFRGEGLLAQRRYAEGFRVYDHAWRTGTTFPKHDLPLPRWNGEPVEGRRFLISGEQGFGDQIMLARFAKLLKDQGADIVWLTRRPLVRLLAQGLGFAAKSLESGNLDLDDVSFFCPSGQLPQMFFPPLTEPPSEPYLTPPPAVTSPGLTIGIAPTGNPGHRMDAVRSLPPGITAQLLDLPGAVDLRPESTGARDFYDTASIIAGLDLVISVDTSVAHLTGAMGRPVWVLIPHLSDWRWVSRENDNPWYPSARLFRQSSPGDWGGVVERVKAALAG